MLMNFTRLAPAERLAAACVNQCLPPPVPDEEEEDSLGRGGDVADRFNRTDDDWC